MRRLEIIAFRQNEFGMLMSPDPFLPPPPAKEVKGRQRETTVKLQNSTVNFGYGKGHQLNNEA